MRKTTKNQMPLMSTNIDHPKAAELQGISKILDKNPRRKRCFGLDTCTWKTFQSFKSYVWASIISANLLTLSRRLAAKTT